MLGLRCFSINYRLPIVSGIYLYGFVRFQLTEYVPFISISIISAFVFV
jgi:hypothetical protein